MHLTVGLIPAVGSVIEYTASALNIEVSILDWHFAELFVVAIVVPVLHKKLSTEVGQAIVKVAVNLEV